MGNRVWGLILSVCCFQSQSLWADKADPPLKDIPPLIENQPDPDLSEAWHLKHIGALEAWKVTKGKPDVTVACVDSGINYNHPDLARNIRRTAVEWPSNAKDDDGNDFIDDVIGWDFVQGDFLPYDRSGHGTFMAGLIAALEGNGLGSAGVCPGCGILPVRFLNWEGIGDDEGAYYSLEYAVNSGVSVINYSVSGEGYDEDIYQILKAALAKDIVVVVAASNDAVNVDQSMIYPAKYKLPNLITVASTDQHDELWEGSNWGMKSVHIGAPGVDIYSTFGDDWEGEGAGTSDSAAIVSGAVGLLRSAASVTASQVKDILMATARKVPGLKHTVASEGVLDLPRAIECARDPKHSCLTR